MPARVVFFDWVYDARSRSLFDNPQETETGKLVERKVREAIETLDPEEQELVHLYWFEGRSINEISKTLGRRQYRIEAMHRRVLKKLKKKLSQFVSETFGIAAETDPDCIICNHPQRAAIEQVLRKKRPDETFRGVYRELRERFGLKISTPQILIGHMKYHMK